MPHYVNIAWGNVFPAHVFALRAAGGSSLAFALPFPSHLSKAKDNVLPVRLACAKTVTVKTCRGGRAMALCGNSTGVTH